MKRKSIFFEVTIILIIALMLLSYVYPIAKAEAILQDGNTSENALIQPSDVDEIKEFATSDELEKYLLLGTTSEEALEKYPGLGLAKYFSLFCEEDATLTGADTEGRIAAGGGVIATTDYKYQVGIGNSNKDTADIIVGDGPVTNVAVNYGYTDDGITKLKDNKIIAYSSNSTKMDFTDYTPEEKEQFIKKDLIDFSTEFQRLREYSQALSKKPATGTRLSTGYTGTTSGYYRNYMVVGNMATDFASKKYRYSWDMSEWYNASAEAIVFHGDNSDENVFEISSDEYESIINMRGIVFDVPYGSNVILNVTGQTKVNVQFGESNNLYYPLSEEKLAEINVNKQRIGYVTKGSSTEYGVSEYIRDENGNIKPFIRVAGGDANEGNMEDISNKILFNFPEVEEIALIDCGAIILAPNAKITSELPYYHTLVGGYALNTVICKSYNGNLQFGTMPNNVTRKYRFNINKLDDNHQNLQGAEFIILDDEENLVYEWTTTDSAKIIELESGKYTLRETKAPSNYEKIDDLIFNIKYDGTICNENGSILANAEILQIEENKTVSYTDHSVDWNADSKQNISYEVLDEQEGLDWTEAIEQNMEKEKDFTYICKDLKDGGYIVVERMNSEDKTNSQYSKYCIPGDQTVDGEDIVYYKGNSKEPCTNSIKKYNSNNKIEWATFVEGSLGLTKYIETDDSYIFIGYHSYYGMYINYNMTVNGNFINIPDYPAGPGSPLVMSINKKGKIENALSIKDTLNNWRFYNFDKMIVEDDNTFYCKENTKSEIVKFTITEVQNSNFPTKWYELYSGLPEEVGNINKLSFKIDTSKATQYAERDIHLVVAENSGKLETNLSSNWIEFTQNTVVQNGDSITTTLPLVESMYPFFGHYDISNIENIKFQPHFYRQNISENGQIISHTTAQEVTDIEVTDIKAYWKEAKTQTTNKITQYKLLEERNNTITICDEHIKTTIQITKKDSETNELLSGAIFGVYDENNQLVCSLNPTNEQGVTVLENAKLNVGNYYIEEITQPQGYKKSFEKINFKVTNTGNFEYEVANDKIKVIFEKVDGDNNLLDGAELSVEDTYGNVVTNWKTTKETKTFEKLAPGTYKLKETYTPTGYIKGNDIIFVVDDFGDVYVDGQKVNKLTMKNIPVKGVINIVKTGEVYSKLNIKDMLSIYTNYLFKYKNQTLEGVTFELFASKDIMQGSKILYEKNAKVGEATTNNLGIATFSELPLGEYYAIEKNTLNGYTIDKTPIIVGVVYKDYLTPVVYTTKTVNNDRVTASVNIEKFKKGSTDKVKGAVYGLYNENKLYDEIPENTLLSTVITDEQGKGTFDIDLPIGNYYIQELESPNGYLLSKESQKIEFNETKEFNLKFEDDYTKVEFSKLIKDTKTPVIGVTLELKDEKGKIVDTWTTDEKSHRIDLLPVGDYVLVEKTPAPGYIKADDKEFTVTATGDIQFIEMEDDYTKVKIKKVNEQNELIGNAKLQIQDIEGNIVEEWTSSESEGYTINAKLLPGETYKLVETQAPKFYNKADDIEFTVNTDGTLNVIKMVDTERPITEDIPQTGEKENKIIASLIYIFGCLAAISLGGILYISDKEKQLEK